MTSPALISRLDRLEDVVGIDAPRRLEEEDEAEVVALHETSDDAPVIKLVNQLVGQAVERGASDLHLAPDGKELRVRFRIDGVLQDVTTRAAADGRRRRLAHEDHGRARTSPSGACPRTAASGSSSTAATSTCAS